MKKYIPLCLIVLGLLLNMFFLHNIYLGSLFTLLYFVVVGTVQAESLGRILNVKNGVLKYILGVGVSVILFGFLASVAVVWYRLPAWLIGILFALFAGLSVFFREWVRVHIAEAGASSDESVFGLFPKSKFLVFCFSVIGILQILILYLCRSGEVLQSPWQVIHPWYLYNFFLLTFLLLLLMCSRISLSAKLGFVIVYSFLLHLYLPLVHLNPWGGDVWRLMGVEGKLLAGQIEPPGFPGAFINPYKYTYGQLWGLVTVLAKATGISLVAFHRWGMAVLWSLVLPALSFVLGRKLFGTDRRALLLSLLTCLPFALQAIGSITVAVSLGFLSFLVGLLLLLSYSEGKNSARKKLCIGFGVLMFFGYALYAILYWMLFGVMMLLQKQSENEKFEFGKLSTQKKYLFLLLALALIAVFPAIDGILGASHFPRNFSFLGALKQFVGQFGGWYFSKPIGESEIASANIVFNHMHLASYVKNIFTLVRFPVIFCNLLIAIFVVRGIYVVIRERKDVLALSLLSLFVSVAGGYILGWYVFVGDRIFVRRLDAIFALLLIAFSLYGIFSIDWKKFAQGWSKKKVLAYALGGFCLYAFVATTIYASGPDLRVMSESEVSTAKVISTLLNGTAVPCVVADTWSLLALEGVSRGRIVGGGFPIGENFGQVERVALYNEFLKNPDERIIASIVSVVPAQRCFVMLSQDALDSRTEVRIHEFLGNAIAKIGDMLFWEMDLKK